MKNPHIPNNYNFTREKQNDTDYWHKRQRHWGKGTLWPSTDNIYVSLDGNDHLFEDGNAFSNDFLNGGTGIDLMSGRRGNVTYIVDNISDQVTEFEGEGIDQIDSTISQERYCSRWG